MSRWAIMMAGLLLVGCNSQPALRDSLPETEVVRIQWPAAPAAGRIRFVREFSTPAELGYRASLSSRFRNFLGGRSDSRLVRPYAIDEDERWLVIADPGAGRVFCLDKGSKKYFVIGASESLMLSSPVGVALSDDFLYVADSALGQVLRFDHRQRLIDSLEQFSRPTSLAYDHESKRLYVADTLMHTIVVVNEQGKTVQTIGRRGNGKDQFNYPSHITLLSDRLLVVDALNFRMQAVSLQGEFINSFGVHGDKPGYFAQPKGIGTDTDGHVYIAESVSGHIQVFDAEGMFLMAWGGRGNEPGKLMLPAGIHISGNNILIADSGNSRIQVFEYLGSPE